MAVPLQMQGLASTGGERGSRDAFMILIPESAQQWSLTQTSATKSGDGLVESRLRRRRSGPPPPRGTPS